MNSRFLTFSKGGGPDKRSHPLHPFIREAVELALASADIRCTFRLPADLPPCEYDRNQLHQVIENLVLNARQAMHGRGTLLVSADTVELAAYQVQGLAGGRFIAVRVADSGPGIPPEVLPRIFEPFFTTKAEGNGLGLASSLSIMRKHGGTLTAENLDTGGCAFTLYLPTG